MKIYFVRHGQSQANLEEREQGALGPLSELGREQAAFVAKRFTDLPTDLIVSSPYERAKETASIINAHLNKEMIFSELLRERKPPTEYIGVLTNDAEYMQVNALMREKRAVDPAWRYSDEDTFDDLKTRAIELLGYLEGLGKENILAVTHGGFLRMIASVMVIGKDLTYEEYVRFFRVLRTKNTGITLIERNYDAAEGEPQWYLTAWNDHAHL